MTRLNLTTEPTWITLLGSRRVRVRPYGDAIFYAAQSYARDQHIDAAKARAAFLAGEGPDTGVPDLSVPHIQEGFAEAAFVRGLAVAAIIEWDGFSVDGVDLEPTAKNIESVFMSNPLISGMFRVHYARHHDMVESEKKD